MTSVPKTELKFTFGTVEIDADVSGRVDAQSAMIDRMKAAASIATNTQLIHYGIVDTPLTGEKTNETFEFSVKAGGINISYTLAFKLNGHVSRATLNDMVFDSISPQVSKAVARYLGEGETTAASTGSFIVQQLRENTNQGISQLAGTSSAYRPGYTLLDDMPEQPGRRREREAHTH